MWHASALKRLFPSCTLSICIATLVSCKGDAPDTPKPTGGEDPDAEIIAPPPEIVVARVDQALDEASVDASLWDAVPAAKVPLLPQNITMPAIQSAAVSEVQVQAATDGTGFALRLSWADASRDEQVDAGRFSDAVAVQFPMKPHAAPMMGLADAPVHILYWKALWQRDLDEGFQDVQDLHPNYWTDLYWFAERPFPYPIPEAFEDPRSHLWFPAMRAGNPVSQFSRESPVQELTAAGIGSLTHQPDSVATGVGAWADGRWTVVIKRPLATDDVNDFQIPVDKPMRLGVAVWQGDAGQAGGRKQWSEWVQVVYRTAARQEIP